MWWQEEGKECVLILSFTLQQLFKTQSQSVIRDRKSKPRSLPSGGHKTGTWVLTSMCIPHTWDMFGFLFPSCSQELWVPESMMWLSTHGRLHSYRLWTDLGSLDSRGWIVNMSDVISNPENHWGTENLKVLFVRYDTHYQSVILTSRVLWIQGSRPCPPLGTHEDTSGEVSGQGIAMLPFFVAGIWVTTEIPYTTKYRYVKDHTTKPWKRQFQQAQSHGLM